MTKSISKNLTSDGVLNNYNILPEQYSTNYGSSSKKSLFFNAGELEVADNDRLTFVEQPDTANAFSISVWINIPSIYSSSSNIQFLVRKGDWSDSNFTGTTREYACGISSGKLFFYLCDESTDAIRKCTADAALSTEFFGKWNHIVFSSRGLGNINDLDIGLNGALVTTTTADSATYTRMENLAGTLKIGGSNLKADIADVSILPADINNTDTLRVALYNGGCPSEIPSGILSQAVAWWRMGDYELDAIDGTGTGSSANRIYDRGTDAVAHNAIPDDSNWENTGRKVFRKFFPAKTDAPCTPFIPFSLGVRGVPFLRNRSEPYKANLD